MAIYTAAAINAQCGGTVISPWDVWQLPQEWLDAFEGLAVRLPKIREGLKRSDAIMAQWREQARKH